MIIFGIVGYLMKRCDYEPAPFVLAFVLGPMFENALRQSLIISGGSPFIFFKRPIAATFLGISFILLVSPFALRALGKQRPGFMLKE